MNSVPRGDGRMVAVTNSQALPKPYELTGLAKVHNLGGAIFVPFNQKGEPLGFTTWGPTDVQQRRMLKIAERAFFREMIVPSCVLCGCSDTDPCFGGCHWVSEILGDQNICSACRDGQPRLGAGNLSAVRVMTATAEDHELLSEIDRLLAVHWLGMTDVRILDESLGYYGYFPDRPGGPHPIPSPTRSIEEVWARLVGTIPDQPAERCELFARFLTNLAETEAPLIEMLTKLTPLTISKAAALALIEEGSV